MTGAGHSHGRLFVTFGGHVVAIAPAPAASSTSPAVSAACEMPTTCEAPAISTVRFAPARSAMIRCAPAGMLWSSSPKMNQLGTERQSGLITRGLEQGAFGDRPLYDGHQRALSRGQVGGELLVEPRGSDVGVQASVSERDPFQGLGERGARCKR